MFPIIPQYVISEVTLKESEQSYTPVMQPIQIPKPKNITSSIASSTSRVAVTSVIEKHDESLNITVSDIINEESKNTDEITIYAANNTIKSNSRDWSWLKRVPLAEDCHSYNIELFQKLPQTALKIKAVRRIMPNEKLILWFSHELVLLLQIPHLSLNNIQGEKQYNCHRCPFQCEMPNPLKIHLALECERLSTSLLWRRLLLLENRTHTLSTAIQVNEPKNAVNFTLNPSITAQKRNSAFKPYKTISKVHGDKTDVKNQADKIRNRYSNFSNIHLEGKNEPQTNATILYKQATELETIVSNLGRFKEGHLCIYCGKVYSRKYGLKIHIRTHTGFKPLKCKYCYRPFGDPSNLNKHVRLHLEGDTTDTFKGKRKKRA